MNPTDEQQHPQNSIIDRMVRTALENARFHERALLSAESSTERQRHVGAIDAYVAVLKAYDQHTDWLAHIRATA